MIPALFALMLVVQDAEQPAAATEAQVEKQAEKSDKRICKVDTNSTGSRMRKKLCLTQTEWDLKAQGKDAAGLKNIGAR